MDRFKSKIKTELIKCPYCDECFNFDYSHLQNDYDEDEYCCDECGETISIVIEDSKFEVYKMH